ncbi:hypothetical protein PENTCL1PPCAC_20659, partial [Pristionchus entomophagus]
YHQRGSEHTLYVKWKGTEINAEWSGQIIKRIRVIGNAIYFYSCKKIYKSTFSPPEEIKISYQRDKLENEKVLHCGLCSRVREGQRFVYRMCDDPDLLGIPIQPSQPGLELRN